MIESALDQAAVLVAREYSPQLIAAAKALAAAAPDDFTFRELWTGIGDLARFGLIDADTDTASLLRSDEPSSSRNQKGQTND